MLDEKEEEEEVGKEGPGIISSSPFSLRSAMDGAFQCISE